MFDDGTFSGQFIGAGVYGYEKDVFQHMRDIEGVAQALSTANYGTFKVLDNNEFRYMRNNLSIISVVKKKIARSLKTKTEVFFS